MITDREKGRATYVQQQCVLFSAECAWKENDSAAGPANREHVTHGTCMQPDAAWLAVRLFQSEPVIRAILKDA